MCRVIWSLLGYLTLFRRIRVCSERELPLPYLEVLHRNDQSAEYSRQSDQRSCMTQALSTQQKL